MLPNVILEVLSLQYFGLLFQEYCVVICVTLGASILIEILDGDGAINLVVSSDHQRSSATINLLLLAMLFSFTYRY